MTRNTPYNACFFFLLHIIFISSLYFNGLISRVKWNQYPIKWTLARYLDLCESYQWIMERIGTIRHNTSSVSNNIEKKYSVPCRNFCTGCIARGKYRAIFAFISPKVFGTNKLRDSIISRLPRSLYETLLQLYYSTCIVSFCFHSRIHSPRSINPRSGIEKNDEDAVGRRSFRWSKTMTIFQTGWVF